MRDHARSGKNQAEAGAALLIAIFALLLVSVVAIALVVSSGTDSALAGNYRTSTSASYAGIAGLEEARGRLLWRNPNFINNTVPGFVPTPGGTPVGLTSVLYILNPLNGETVAPTDLSNPATYPDNEYQNEFNIPLSSASVQQINSVSGIPGLPGPLFKWVRITAATEKSLGINVNQDALPLDSITPLYYDPANVAPGFGPKPSLIVTLSPPATAQQVLEITALAVLPNNTQKLLQYVVAPGLLSLSFPAGLTLDGNSATYLGPNSSSFFVNGNDPTTGRTCSSPALSPVPAIGYTNGADASQTNIVSGTSVMPSNYVGYTPPPPAPATPSMGVVSLPANLQTPSQFNSLVQTIKQGADVVIPGPASASNLNALGMTPANPMTVVVNGDLDLTSWHSTGYGLLLVTGNLNYDPDASWAGIVLVVGKGTVTGSRSGSGRIDGAMLVAQTQDALGNLLPDPNLGTPSVNFGLSPTMGGQGIYYNSCWIAAAQPSLPYKVLSYREIPITN
jgi:hypothetical protein